MTTDRPNATFTVMTFNVGNGLATASHLPAFLRHSGADLIGLQELDEAQADAIERHTAEHYPFRILRGSGFEGRGFLSRHPIQDHEWLGLIEHRPDLRVTVEIAGAAVTLFVAHPPPPRFRRQGVIFDPETISQIDQLSDVVMRTAPAILVGDFNMTARHPKYAHLVESGLIDAFGVAGAGRGATFPTRPGRFRTINHRLTWVPLPVLSRVDYIWHTREFAAKRAWVGRRGAGSDHLPVFAEIELVTG